MANRVETGNPLLALLTECPGLVQIKNRRAWQRFRSDADTFSENHEELLGFVCRFSWSFQRFQERVCRLLMSFDFRLDLEHVNVHFENLQIKSIESILMANPPKISEQDLIEYFKKNHFIPESSDRGKLANPNRLARAIEDRNRPQSELEHELEKLVIKVIVLSYRFLCRRLGLENVCRALNSAEETRVLTGLWTETLIVRLLFHYASFDLGFKLTGLLIQRGVAPIMLGCPDQTPTPGDSGVKSSLCSEHTEEPPTPTSLNPLTEFWLSGQMGVLAVSVGSANRRRLGKSELLNKIFFTRFQTDENGPLRHCKVEVDLGRNFSPQRRVAVIDSNLSDRASFRLLCRVVNLVLVSVSFEDLADDFERTQQEIMKLTDHCSEKGIKTIVVVRDSGRCRSVGETDHCVFQPKSVRSDRGSYAERNPEKDDPSESEKMRILREVKEYKIFSKNKKAQKREFDFNFKKKNNAMERLKADDIFGAEAVQVVRLKHLGQRSTHDSDLEELIRRVNAAIAEVPGDRFKFTSKNFRKMCKKTLIREDLAEQMSAVESDFKKLINNFEKSKKKSLFPFDRLWQRQTSVTAKLMKFSPNKRELEVRLSKIKSRIERVRIGSELKAHFHTLAESRQGYSLLTRFEAWLADRPTPDADDSRDDPEALQSVSYAVSYWRNLEPFLSDQRSDLSQEEKLKYIGLIENMLVKGYGLELIDGEHFLFRGSVLSQMRGKLDARDEVATLAVIGPQSSGKSTLVNFQFGVDFQTGIGKCTSGVSGYLLRLEDRLDRLVGEVLSRKYPSGRASNSPNELVHSRRIDLEANTYSSNNLDSSENTGDDRNPREIHSKQGLLTQEKVNSTRKRADYGRHKRRFLLLVDTQGVQSQEVRDEQLDKKIGTWSLGVADAVHINFSGELLGHFSSLLEVCQFSCSELRRKSSLFALSSEDETVGSGKPGTIELTTGAGPEVFFISNCNYNLGSASKKEQARKVILSNAREMTESLRQICRDAHAFRAEAGRVEILESAFNCVYVEKDSSLGQRESMKRVDVNSRFVAGLDDLRTRTVKAARDKSRPLEKVIEMMGPAWDFVYLRLKRVELRELKQRIVNNMYEQVVDERLKRHIQEWHLESNFVAEIMQKRVARARRKSEKSGNKAKYKLFDKIFGETGSSIVELLTQARQHPHKLQKMRETKIKTLILDVVKKDVRLVEEAHSRALSKVEERLKDWIHEKKK